MADNKKARDSRDRAKVAAGQGYEVDYFAKKHGLSAQQARDLIERRCWKQDENGRWGQAA